MSYQAPYPDREWHKMNARIDPEGTIEVKLRRVTITGLKEWDLAVFYVADPILGYGAFGVLEIAGMTQLVRGDSQQDSLRRLRSRISREGLKAIQGYLQGQTDAFGADLD